MDKQEMAEKVESLHPLDMVGLGKLMAEAAKEHLDELGLLWRGDGIAQGLAGLILAVGLLVVFVYVLVMWPRIMFGKHSLNVKAQTAVAGMLFYASLGWIFVG